MIQAAKKQLLRVKRLRSSFYSCKFSEHRQTWMAIQYHVPPLRYLFVDVEKYDYSVFPVILVAI